MKAAVPRETETADAGPRRKSNQGFALKAPRYWMQLAVALRRPIDGIDLLPLALPATQTADAHRFCLPRQESDLSAGRLAAAPVTEAATRGNRGDRLDDDIRAQMEGRVGRSLADIRVHTDPDAAKSAAALNANAYTTGRDIYFAAGKYAASRSDRNQLLAHELVHTVQAQRSEAPSPVAALEREARALAAAFSLKLRAPLPVLSARGLTVPLREDAKKDDQPNPIASWQHSDGAILIVRTPDRVFILPGGQLAWIPDAKSLEQFKANPAFFNTDLGTLFETPATGASGSRVFRAGPRAALMLDAGSDPTRSMPAAVYLSQLNGVFANLGIMRLDALQIIHVHRDHVNQLPTVVGAIDIAANKVIIPQQFINTTAEITRVVRALQTTTDAALLTKGFGPAWQPGKVLADSGGPGDVSRNTYRAGELVVESVSLRSAMRDARRNPDLAEPITKITRPKDQSKVVVLGDLRGSHLSIIRAAMEANSPGSFAEFFAGVHTLSGFSHHAGRLEAGDVAGIMSLLEATLYKTGSLRVVEQTNLGTATRARTDTLELLSRLGVNVVTAEMPAAGAGPSAAGATRDTVYSRGSAATTRPVTPSAATDALGRIQRLIAARETIETWRPWFEEVDPKAKDYFDDLLPRIDASLESLRIATRNAGEAAVRVRASGPTRPDGGRDYSATGGALANAFNQALAAIPAETSVEAEIKPEGFEALNKFSKMPSKDIPLRVLLHKALTKGEYSPEAFTYMLSQLDPATRDSLLSGPRGGPTTKSAAWTRVRAQFGFQSVALEGQGEFMRMPSGLSKAGEMRVRGVAGVMLFLELWNDIVEPIVSGVRTAKVIYTNANLLPFVRRLLFWQQAKVFPKVVGVSDPTFGSPRYERNYNTVVDKLNDNLWEALFIESPGLSDTDVVRFGVWLSYFVRNIDEFQTLFDESHQDAITWETPSGAGWVKAKWNVRTGFYETSGSNHVSETWEYHERLTQLMNMYVQRLMVNTDELLRLRNEGKAPTEDVTARLGSLDIPTVKVQGRAHLKPSFQGQPTKVRVPPIDTSGSSWGSANAQATPAEVKWWSPPHFLVVDRTGDYAVVAGADYNTHAVIRGLATERWYSVMGGDYLSRPVGQKALNERSIVNIHMSYLEGDAPYQIPEVAPPASLRDSPAASGRK